jgi:beta-barrel assembly-enhancing protease
MRTRKFKIAGGTRRAVLALAFLASALLAGIEAPARDQERGSRVDAGQRDLERLRRIMIPLIRATEQPQRLEEITVKVVADPSINAGSAGDGQFLITTGLLRKANDDHLRGILAHEIAHDDLRHPAKMQLVGTGLTLGAALLEQVFPGSGVVTPIAGTLIASSYSRPQELEADRHAVTILRRAGHSKEPMIKALTWILQVQGNSGGGLLSTHPATEERIRALRRL